MSERFRARLGRTVLVALLATTGPGLVSAQSRRAADLVRTYRVQRDSLTVWIDRVDRHTAANVDSARKAWSIPVTRGSITVQTAPAFAEIATVAIMRVDSLMARSPLGGAIRQPVTLRLHPHWEHLEYRASEHRMWMLDLVNADGSESGAEWWQSEGEAPLVDDLANALQFNERNRRQKLIPSALGAWLNGTLMELNDTDRWVSAYTSLASSPTTIGTACLVGNVGACKQVLLLEPTRDRLADWFTPSSRRTLVLPYWKNDTTYYVRRRIDSTMAGALTACVNASDDLACTRILRDYMGPDGWGDPMRSPSGREALINAAIRMPGAPGLPAILGRTELGVVASIEAMSGKKLDEVLQSWITQMRNAEPDRVQLPAHRVLTATLWIFVFGAVALRGSRWR